MILISTTMHPGFIWIAIDEFGGGDVTLMR
jgi:hypothetical protein